MPYAASTAVPVERSKTELMRLLERAGAQQRAIVEDDRHYQAFVHFVIDDRRIRLQVPLPTPEEHTSNARGRLNSDQALRAYDQARRSRWQSMVLLLKAKLEAIALGLSTPEREFLADLLLPNRETVHASLAEHINEAYASGKVPPLLGPAGLL